MTTSKLKISLPWLMVFCAAFYYFFQFILRAGFGVMTQDLMREFNVDAAEISWLSSFYYNAYAAMQIPIGLLLDRFGPRRVIALACFLAVLGTFVFAFAPNIYVCALGRLLVGAGTSCGFIGAIKMATLWLPINHVGRAIGLTMFMGTLGANFAASPMRWLVENLGWRDTLTDIAFVGLILGFVLYGVLRDKAVLKDGHEVTPTPLNYKEIFAQIGDIISRPQVWFLALFGMLMYAPLAAIADLWGPAMMSSFYGISQVEAAFMVSFIYIGVAIGSPFKAWVAELRKSRKFSMLTSALLGLGIYAILIYGPTISQSLMYIVLFLAGFSFGGQNMVFASISESLPLRMTGVALGFLNMVVMMSGVVFQPLVGSLLASTHGGEVACFSPENFRFALMPIPFALLAALFVWTRIKETYKTH